jgi:hypothetical protein
MEKLYTVTRPYAGFRPPDRMATDKRSGEGNILSLAHAGILHSSMPEISSIMGEGQKFPTETGGFSQNCNFSEESFILISFCYSVALLLS